MNLIKKAQRYAQKFGGISGASVKLGIPPSTLRGWLAKAEIKRKKTAPQIPPPEKPKGMWMQSVLQDSAHYIIAEGHDRRAACHGSPSGLRIDQGMHFVPWNGCLRKCLRCMKHVENDKLNSEP